MAQKEQPIAGEVCESPAIHQDVVDVVAKQLQRSQPDVAPMAAAFKVFGDPTRLRLLCALLCHEMCVCDLCCLLGMRQSAISHQLRTLRQARLVKSRKEGKTVYYSIMDEHVSGIIEQMQRHVQEED